MIMLDIRGFIPQDGKGESVIVCFACPISSCPNWRQRISIYYLFIRRVDFTFNSVIMTARGLNKYTIQFNSILSFFQLPPIVF